MHVVIISLVFFCLFEYLFKNVKILPNIMYPIIFCLEGDIWNKFHVKMMLGRRHITIYPSVHPVHYTMIIHFAGASSIRLSNTYSGCNE